jgi:hypothetical protein
MLIGHHLLPLSHSSVVARQRAVLDVAYLRRWLEELGRLADDPQATARFERSQRSIFTSGRHPAASRIMSRRPITRPTS